jgi:zinc finger protein ubi-d4
MSSSSFDLYNLPNISKIESFLNDSSYRESIEISANFNTRLCLERKLRMPFLDPQTGVAQNHSNLYMKKSQRMPGLREGQIYTYPMTNRWRKSKRQYLAKMQCVRPFSNFRYRSDNVTNSPIPIPIVATAMAVHPSLANSTGIMPPQIGLEGEQSDFQALIDESNSLGADTDSKDSQNIKDDLPKDWYYDEAEINDVDKDEFSEQGDSDYDYNINGYKRKRKRPTKSTRKSKAADSLPYNSESGRKVIYDRQIHSSLYPHLTNLSFSFQGRSSGSATGSARKYNRRKNPSTRSNKTDVSDTTNEVEIVNPKEPPSFQTIEQDLNLNLNENSNHEFGSYRKYL